MTKLYVAQSLALPIEAVTQTFGVLGMRGSGKSNAAVVMAEEMFRAKLHWVAIDPKGDWWGVRSMADGKTAGLPVVVFGGRHGDVPLEPASGPLIADLVINQTMTAVLDLSEFTEGDKIRFLAGVGSTDGFAGRFYRRKSEDQPPTHLFLEEADDYLPQKAMRDKAKLLHDCSRLFLWGRARGVGGTLITQRSARIHKDTLTQVGTLIVFRTPAPQDQKAILDWIKYHGQSEEVMQSLSGLVDGEGWIWSPEWLDKMQRVQFRQRETFDSGRTPKLGQKARTPATLADIDLEAIKIAMSTTIEKAKESDPRELNKKIVELERQLRDRPAETVEVEKVVEVPVLNNGQLDRTEKIAERVEALAEKVSGVVSTLTAEIAELRQQIAPARTPQTPISPPKPIVSASRSVPVARLASKTSGSSVSGHLPIGERKILAALIQYPSGLRREQLTVLTGYKRSSRDAYISRLREKGFVIQSGELIVSSPDGIAALPDAEPLPIGVALRDYWLARLPPGERAILEALIFAYPKAVRRDDLDDATGYKRSSRDAYISRLAAKELIADSARGEVRASDNLFS